ncbi:hypothetical protein Tco_1570818 [Tanacetum coccineum]
MERMLKHKLEIDKDVVGNDMTTAEQLIRFIKNQIAAAQSVAGLRFPDGSSMLLTFDVQDQQGYEDSKLYGQDSTRLDVAAKFIFQSSRYVVPTGRVVVPTGRYVVPAGKVIIIVSPGRLSLVPTGRVLSPGPYTPSTVIIPAVPATDNSPAVPERTTVETILNMYPKNKAHFESEKEAIHLILTGIGDEIY